MLIRTKAPRTGAPKKPVAVLILIAFICIARLFYIGTADQLHYFYDNIANTDIFATVKTSRSGGHEDDASLEFRSKNITFPRALEWYEYWTYASKKGQDPIENAHRHDDYVVSTAKLASDDALMNFNIMKKRYASVRALPDFYARGLGWVQNRLNLVLTAIIAGDIAASDRVLDGADGDGTILLHAGPVTIFIVDTIGKTKCDGEGESWKDVQPPLTMWVRAYGVSPGASGETEIFAGTALPHNLESSTLCAWRYDFEPKNEGLYSTHVKVLTFNGFVDSLSSKCLPYDTSIPNMENHKIEQGMRERYSHHRGVYGFKFYGPEDACCEVCKRARNCKMFSFPGLLKLDHCELYFDLIEDDVDFLDRSNGHYLGRYRNYSYVKQEPTDFPNIRRRRLALSPDETIEKKWQFPPARVAGDVTYYIGCGWSATMSLEHPCHYPSDDLVFGSGVKFEVVENNETQEHTVPDTLPPCVIDDEKLDLSNGRWVRHPYPDDTTCPPLEEDTLSTDWEGFKPKYHGDLPHCWHVDDISRISNECVGEADCGLVIGHRWVTDLKRESKWYGWWKPYKCQYRDMGDNEIQHCVDKKGIAKIELRGMSIRNIISGYLEPKLRNIKMKNETSNLIVTLDTLAMPHLLWGRSIDEYVAELRNFPDMPTDTEIESYFVTGFYYTSEREPHVTVDRSLQYSKLAYDVLSPKGYIMINAFDVTAAFAYDTDGQADGMHIAGPPIRTIITKFFHHLCNDVLAP